jgi:hypothetical protein
VLVTVLLLGYWQRSALEPGTLRALTFVALVAGNLAILLASRSLHEPFWRLLARRSLAPLLLIGGALSAAALALFVPVLRELFSFSVVSGTQVAVWGGASALPILLLDVRKAFGRA